MRHGDKQNNLGRKKGHRDAMLKNMAASLFVHKRINTTIAKAKALRGYVEPLLTKSKLNTTHSRRVVFSYLQDKESIKELFDVIAPKIATRPGGYVRIIKTGFRQGDGAETALIELVDFNEVLIEAKANAVAAAPAKKRTRRGRGKAKVVTEATTSTTETVTQTSEVATETQEG